MSVELQWADLATIVLYLATVVLIGAWFSRHEETSEDYLLGGRRVPWWAAGISYMMSLLSTVSLVMVPGEVFNHGLSLFLLTPLYPLTSILMFWLFVRFYYRLQVFTPFSYLERRYDRGVRLLITIIYLWTRLIYLGMVIFSSSKVFEGAAGWPAWFTILLVGVIGIVYTALGGIRAVIWTDVMQFAALFAGLSITTLVCSQYVDGGFWGGVGYSIRAGHGADMFARAEFYAFNPYVRLCFWILLLGKFTEPLFYSTADQISLQRLLSTASFKEGFRAMVVNAVAGIPFTFMMLSIGLIIFAYYAQHPDSRVTSGDTALFTFVSTRLPTPLPGLMLAAMLAAVMSTLDSGMNSLSAVGLKDLYVQYWKQDATEKQQVWVARVLTVVVGAFAIALALGIALSSQKLAQSVVEAGVIWAALSSVVAPVFLVGFTTRRVDSSIIWAAVVLTWGVNFGMTTWYVLSKMGRVGPLEPVWVAVPVILTVAAAVLPRLVGSARPRSLNPHNLWALFPAGYTAAAAFWWIASHYLGGGKLSFQWVGFPGFVVFLMVTYGSVLLRRPIDAARTAGLTLWSQQEPAGHSPGGSASQPPPTG